MMRATQRAGEAKKTRNAMPRAMRRAEKLGGARRCCRADEKKLEGFDYRGHADKNLECLDDREHVDTEGCEKA